MTYPPIEVECAACHGLCLVSATDTEPYQCETCGSAEMHDEQQAVDDLRDERDSE